MHLPLRPSGPLIRLLRRSLVVMASLSASLSAGCVYCLGLSREFDDESARIDEARSADNVDRLVDMCFHPEEHGACNGYVRIPVPGIADRACSEMKAAAASRHERALAQALAASDRGALRRLCANTRLYESVTNEELGLNETATRACDGLAAMGAAAFAAVQEEATGLGGARCLARLQSAWSEFERDQLWVTETQSAAAQQRAFAAPAERCLAALEAQAKEDVLATYQTLRAVPLTAGPSLEEGQAVRLRALLAQVPASAAKTLAEAAAQAPPATQALAFAVASAISAEAKDAAAATRYRDAARSAAAREGTPEHITVAVVGDGSAAAIARVVRRTASRGVVFTDAEADVVLTLTLSEPALSATSAPVRLSASVREQSGTKKNPAYTKKQEACERYERTLTSKASYCAENPQVVNCDWYKRDVEQCSRELAKMSDTVPAYKDVDVAYGGTRYEGRAAGTLTIARTGGRTTTHSVVGADSRVGHEGAPRAQVAPVSASPFGRSELAALYESSAATVVGSYVAALVDARAAAVLEEAQRTDDKAVLIAAAVRYAIIAKRVLPLPHLDDKLGFPASMGLAVLAR